MEEASQDGQQREEGCASTEGMLELDRLKLDDAAAAATTNSNSQNNTSTQPSRSSLIDNDADGQCSDSSDYDDDDDDEGISSSYHSTHDPTPNSEETTHFLGHRFDARADQIPMHAFRKSLYWLTYRNDLVVPLRRPYAAANAQSLAGNIAHGGGFGGVTMGGEGGMKSDAGWGCMLRSAQMLLAEAVRRHYAPEEPGSERGVVDSSKNGCRGGGRRARGKIRHHHHSGNGEQRHGSDDCSNIEHHGQNWRRLEDPWEVERIAKWFADFPNHADFGDDMENDTGDINNDCYGKGGLNYHWYSLHQMVAAGLGLGILPGEWYGPTTACHVLRELNEMHCERRERLARKLNSINSKGNNDSGEVDSHRILACDMFRVHVATEGTIYRDAISKLMTQQSDGGSATDNAESATDKINHDPLSMVNDQIDDPLRPQQKHNNMSKAPIEQWETSLLLLLPLRLGIQSISASDYGSTLSKLMAFPHSVGMLGGTPRHALWFYGADAVDPPSSDEKGKGSVQDCAGGWHGLDPHTVQIAPRGTRVIVETTSTTNNNTPSYRWQVQLTDAYLRSLHFSPTTSHANHERCIPLSGLDTSCALGFYIRNAVDFLHFQSLLNTLSEEHCKPNKLPEIISVLEKTPNYAVDVSAMNGMLGSPTVDEEGVGDLVEDLDGFSMQSEGDNVDVGHDDDDDDSFVLI